ncbi:RsiV family protein [Neolewinella persica]|uniref:RsiV family protein n=1 Tax=Neolewinella persica TaxID=70998 RepID=UPI00037F317F|nr:RsiV family protein [Neolewinella persica]
MKYLLLLPLVFLLSCQNQDSPSVEPDDDDDVTMPVALDSVAFEVFEFADSALLVQAYRNSPQVTFQVSTLVPKSGNEQLNNLINTALAKVIAGEEAPISVTNLPQTIKIASRNVLYNYRKQDVDTADLEDMWASYSLDHHFQTEVLLNTNNLLTLATNHYFYTGGAHGNHYTILHTFSTDSVQLLTFDDIFLPGQVAELEKLLTQKAKAIGLGYQTETVPVTENIAFTKEGLLFDYPPYEIASYADGEIEIVLPYAEVSHLLTERGESLALTIVK